jgi:hypothetical protein
VTVNRHTPIRTWYHCNVVLSGYYVCTHIADARSPWHVCYELLELVYISFCPRHLLFNHTILMLVFDMLILCIKTNIGRVLHVLSGRSTGAPAPDPRSWYVQINFDVLSPGTGDAAPRIRARDFPWMMTSYFSSRILMSLSSWLVPLCSNTNSMTAVCGLFRVGRCVHMWSWSMYVQFTLCHYDVSPRSHVLRLLCADISSAHASGIPRRPVHGECYRLQCSSIPGSDAGVSRCPEHGEGYQQWLVSLALSPVLMPDPWDTSTKEMLSTQWYHGCLW